MTTTNTRTAPGDPAPEPRHASLEQYDTFVSRVLAACADSGTQQALRRGLGKPVGGVPAHTQAALLRRGLVPDDIADTRKQAYYTVAALIAARPRAQRIAGADTEGGGDAPGTDTAGACGPPTGTGPDTGTGTGAGPGADTDTGTGSDDAKSAAAGFRSRGTSLGETMASAVTSRGAGGIKEDGAESRLHLMVRQDVDGIHRMLPGVLRHLGSAGATVDYACLLKDLIAWRYDRGHVTTRWLEGFYRTLRQAAKTQAQSPRGALEEANDPAADQDHGVREDSAPGNVPAPGGDPAAGRPRDGDGPDVPAAD